MNHTPAFLPPSPVHNPLWSSSHTAGSIGSCKNQAHCFRFLQTPNLRRHRAANFVATQEQPSQPDAFPEENLEPQQLRWSEIPFASIHEELDAIDEYEMREDLDKEDPWPKFLRGAAYEFWGQPKLALAQYALTSSAASLRLVPELWERRAYNSFKMGEVITSNAYFDIATVLFAEGSGNQLHFMHWFYDNFADYIPKRNGPPPPLQRAICKYCFGSFAQARDSLVAQLATVNFAHEHSLLWMFAVSYRHAEDNVLPKSDLLALHNALQVDYEWDPKMAKLITLFAAAAKKETDEQVKAEREVAAAVQGTDDSFDIVSNLYFALYHDAFTGAKESRDILLDRFNDIEGSPSPNDVENFLFHVAKNRLTVPPTAEITEIPELER